jgi:hypothetical protein
MAHAKPYYLCHYEFAGHPDRLHGANYLSGFASTCHGMILIVTLMASALMEEIAKSIGIVVLAGMAW